MSELTIDSIKAEHERLGAVIASFEKKSRLEAAFPITVSFPKLNAGERYVATIITAEKREHLILLPGDNDDATWADQRSWANDIGGRLPFLYEQALLRKVMPEEFRDAAYWSCEEHASTSGLAWSQYFANGGQNCLNKNGKHGARAVRSEAF